MKPDDPNGTIGRAHIVISYFLGANQKLVI